MTTITVNDLSIKTCTPKLTKLWEKGRACVDGSRPPMSIFWITDGIKAVLYYVFCGDAERKIPSMREHRAQAAIIAYRWAISNPRVWFHDDQKLRDECWRKAHYGYEQQKQWHHDKPVGGPLPPEVLAAANDKRQVEARWKIYAVLDRLYSLLLPGQRLSLNAIAAEAHSDKRTVKAALLWMIEHKLAGKSKTPLQVVEAIVRPFKSSSSSECIRDLGHDNDHIETVENSPPPPVKGRLQKVREYINDIFEIVRANGKQPPRLSGKPIEYNRQQKIMEALERFWGGRNIQPEFFIDGYGVFREEDWNEFSRRRYTDTGIIQEERPDDYEEYHYE